jgi:hypothetical protein
MQAMIDEMIKSGDYPKTKLNKAIVSLTGDELEDAVVMIFAEWVLSKKLPTIKHQYFTPSDTGEWQSWI